MLSDLGLNIASVATQPEILGQLLNAHIATVTSLDDTQATALSGQIAMFQNAGAAASLSSFTTATAPYSGLTVAEGSTSANVTAVVACPAGPVYIALDAALLPTAPTPAPAPAPTPPSPGMPTTITIGALVDSLCPAAKDALAPLTILNTLLPMVKDTEIELPPGPVVLVGPTNTAFTNLLSAAGVSPSDSTNITRVTAILAQHLAVAVNTDSTTADAVSGEVLSFMNAGSSVSLATLAADAAGQITDSDSLQTANVEGAVACGTTAYVFVVDTVLIPSAYTPTAPTPAAEPTTPDVVSPSPVPAPAPASSALSFSSVSSGLIAGAAVVAAIMA